MLFNNLWTYPKSKNQNLVLTRGHVKSRITVACFKLFLHTPPLPSFLTLCLVFTVASQVFAVEQFGIRRWRANGKKNLLMVKIKIGPLEPEQSWNLFEQSKLWRKALCMHCTVHCTVGWSDFIFLRNFEKKQVEVARICFKNFCHKFFFE